MSTKFIIFILLLIPLTFSQAIYGNISIAKSQSNSTTFSQLNAQDTIDTVSELAMDEFEEVFLAFSYMRLINRTLVVNYDKVFFLPIGEIFDLLLLNNAIDKQNGIIKGFYIYPENEYEINFNNLTFKSRNNEFTFSKSDFVEKEFEYYLSPELFYKAFKLSFSIDLNNLTLNLASEDILPVYSKYLREEKYKYFSRSEDVAQYPLLFPRERNYLSGGFLDYSLTSSFSKQHLPLYNYGLGLGIELFGGDLQTSLTGYTLENVTTTSEFQYRWRYGLDKNKFLSQVSVGNLFSTGINSQSFHGLQVSNQPLEQRETFEKFLITDQTVPGSTIELYINNQLIDHTRTDAAGNFRFWIPLTYGSSFISYKYYGPNGEIKIVDRYYQIPYSLNPPEEFNYTVDLGKIENSNNNYVSVSGIYGINDWLSNTIGAEYLADKLFNKPIFYNSLTARISSSYLLNVLTAPNSFHRLSANAIYPSLTAINLSYTNYETNLLYNPTKLNHEVNAALNLPIYIDESPLNIQINGDFQDFSSSTISGFRVSTSKNIGSFTPTLVYSFRQFESTNFSLRQPYLSTGVIYSVNTLPEFISFLRGLLINSGTNYNFNSSKIESYFISFASNITNTVRLQFDYEKNLTIDYTNARMQVFLELPFTRSYSIVGKDYFTSNIRGSMLLNDSHGQINFFNREQIGRAAASFRMFIDENANGIYDDSEQSITKANLKIESLNSAIRTRDGKTEVKDLNPFSIYNVKIDEASLENPLFTPKDKEFSFEASPNTIKNIDIPFYNASEVSGNVKRVLGELKSPLAGIKIHIEGIDNNQNITTNSYSDGSFYYFGLKPGKFKIYLNKNQVELLKAISVPAEIMLEIDASGAGQFIENINFELVPN